MSEETNQASTEHSDGAGSTATLTSGDHPAPSDGSQGAAGEGAAIEIVEDDSALQDVAGTLIGPDGHPMVVPPYDPEVDGPLPMALLREEPTGPLAHAHGAGKSITGAPALAQYRCCACQSVSQFDGRSTHEAQAKKYGGELNAEGIFWCSERCLPDGKA
jgi:hypothetical protein